MAKFDPRVETPQLIAKIFLPQLNMLKRQFLVPNCMQTDVWGILSK